MTLLTLVLYELYNLLYEFNRNNLSLFILNFLMFVFYNSNSDVLVESEYKIYTIGSLQLKNGVDFMHQQVNLLLNNFLDYFFSKNTQFLLKFTYNLTKMKLVKKYTEYKNYLFNPVLLTETNKEEVYCVPFYLNGTNYKIPIVVNKNFYNTKQPPLMILNNEEEDITQNIIDLMGPNNDFYGMMLKPKHLKQKSLNFMMEDGSEMNIKENDIIVL